MSNLLFTMLLFVQSSSWTELAVDYKKCVESFAIGQIRSVEPARILVAAGEAECRGKVSDLEQALRESVTREILELPEAEKISRNDLQIIIDETFERRRDDTTKFVRESALRNVVVFKARMNEIDAPNK